MKLCYIKIVLIKMQWQHVCVVLWSDHILNGFADVLFVM